MSIESPQLLPYKQPRFKGQLRGQTHLLYLRHIQLNHGSPLVSSHPPNNLSVPLLIQYSTIPRNINRRQSFRSHRMTSGYLPIFPAVVGTAKVVYGNEGLISIAGPSRIIGVSREVGEW